MSPNPKPGHREVLSILVTAALLVPAGCGTGEPTVSARLQLVVADNHVRAEGDECGGARPYGYVRAGALFTVEGQDGTVLASGQLPPGRAENADPSIEWGVERFPTVCVLALTLDGLPARPRYQLRLPEGEPLPFEAPREAPNDPIVVIVQ